MDKYFSFKTPITNNIIIKRSEFITNLIPVNNELEIDNALKSLRKVGLLHIEKLEGTSEKLTAFKEYTNNAIVKIKNEYNKK